MREKVKIAGRGPPNGTDAKASGLRRDPSKIQVISRAAAVLRSLENEQDGLSLGAIAQRLGLPRSTVQRIVNALESEDLVIAASPKARVRLGPALARLAASVEMSVAKLARPLMEQLARDLGETVDLSVLASDHAVFIERVIGAHSVYAIAGLAVHYPLHCTANGRAMLAELTDAQIEQRIGRSYERRTSRSLTTFDTLIVALRSVRRTGVAYSVEENALGICGIGVAVHDARGNLLSLSVPVPTSRFEQQKKRIAQGLLEARDILQRRLGSAA
jgi:DNA-binding IclR family transcriptional regulator